MGHRALIQDLQRLSDNLSFARSDVILALKGLHEYRTEHGASWVIQDGQSSAWAKDIDAKLRHMLRHIQQGRVRQTSAQWLKLLALPDYVGKSVGDGDASPKKKAMKKAMKRKEKPGSKESVSAAVAETASSAAL